MIHDEIIPCPVCDHQMSIKVHVQGKNLTYLVSDDCPNCKTPANKIENSLNRSNKKHYVKVEKSFLKEQMKLPTGK